MIDIVIIITIIYYYIMIINILLLLYLLLILYKGPVWAAVRVHAGRVRDMVDE